MAVIQYARRYTCDLCAAEAENTDPHGQPPGWLMAQIAHSGAFYSLNLCEPCAHLSYAHVAEQLAAKLTARGE